MYQVAYFLCAALFISAASAQIQKKHFCFSGAHLLSEDLTSCQDPNATSCKGGIASASAYVRHLRNQGGQVMFFMPPEQFVPFVQMHRDRWNVNMAFFKRFGVTAFAAESNLVVTPDRFNALLDVNVPFVTANLMVDPTNQWSGLTRTYFIDPETKIGFTVIIEANAIGMAPWLASTHRALQALRKARDAGMLEHIVVIDYNSQALGSGAAEAMLRAIQQETPIKIDAFLSAANGNSDNFTQSINGTAFMTIAFSPAGRSGTGRSELSCFDFDVNTASQTITYANATNHNLYSLPLVVRGHQFYADIAWVQAQADQAAFDDPIVGYSTKMVRHREDNGPWRLCPQGECPQGRLWTDAYRWQLGVDVAFQNSGGLHGGTGWPAGPVKMSYIYGSQPWANYLCNATVTGLSLWEMINASVSVRYYDHNVQPDVSIHAQMAGVRVYVNRQLSRFNNLIRVDVQDRATGEWRPLDRFKLYTMTITNFECNFVEPYASIMQNPRYVGERKAQENSQYVIQRVVGAYLSAVHNTPANPYNTTGRQYLIDVSNSSDPVPSDLRNSRNYQAWTQTQSSCGKDTWWDAKYGSCRPCPDGERQPESGQTSCEEDKRDILIVAIVVPIAAVVIIVAAVLVGLLSRSSDVRDVSCAPTGGRIVTLFTDIQDSTKLWSTVPMSMNEALEQHHALIRKVITKHKAYEVKTVGDAFMIAMAGEDTAVKLCGDIQHEFQNAKWPACIAQVYEAHGDEKALALVEDDPDAEWIATPTKAGGIHGLRIRIGFHSGEPKAEKDTVTHGYDYFGPSVNLSARVESTAQGGQVCCSAATYALLSADVKETFAIRSIGKYELKGVPEPTEVFEVLPKDLAEQRQFEIKPQKSADPKDTDAGDVGDAAEVDSDIGTASTFGSHASQREELLQAIEINRLFYNGLFRTFRKPEQARLRGQVFKAWHIEDGIPEDKIGTEKDHALFQLCRRVTLSIARKRMQAEMTFQQQQSEMQQKGTATPNQAPFN